MGYKKITIQATVIVWCNDTKDALNAVSVALEASAGMALCEPIRNVQEYQGGGRNMADVEIVTFTFTRSRPEEDDEVVEVVGHIVGDSREKKVAGILYNAGMAINNDEEFGIKAEVFVGIRVPHLKEETCSRCGRADKPTTDGMCESCDSDIYKEGGLVG